MVDQTVPLDVTPQQPTVDLDTSNALPSVDLRTADQRSEKANFGLKKYMPQEFDKQGWYVGITQGREGDLRNSAAYSINADNTQRKIQALGQAAPDDLQRILNEPTRTDPRSVIEDYYAKEFHRPLTDLSNHFINSSLMGDGMREIPQVVDAGIQHNIQLAAKEQYRQTQLQNLAPQVSTAQSLLMGVIPGATMMAMRLPALHGQGIAAAFHGILPQNLEEQATHYWSMPFNEFKDFTDSVVANLGPTLAYQWLDAMGGQSVADKVDNAAYDVIDIGTLVSVTKILASDVLKGIRGVSRGAGTAGTEHPIEVAQPALTGDLNEAAVKQASANLDATKNAASNPSQLVQVEARQDIQSLTSNFRIDMQEIERGPGSWGQDIVNRIREANDNFVQNMNDKIDAVIKVNRTPYVVAKEDVIRAETDRIKGQYRGLGNAILDIHGPEYGELENTYHWRVTVGDYDGHLFKSRKQAELFAEFNGFHIRQAIQEPYGHEPIGGMNRAPIEYDKFSEFRKAARAAGLKDKDLKAAGLGTSIDLQKARLSQTNRPGTDTGAEIKLSTLVDINTQGSGFYIEVRKPYDESNPALIKWLGQTSQTATPYSWINSVTGRIRDPDQTLSVAETENRRVAAHAGNVLKDVDNPEWKIISSIHKGYWGKFDQMLKAGQDLYDEQGRKGYFFKSPQDIEDWFHLYYPDDESRIPPEVIEGYFALKRLANFDLALRNISQYRAEATKGVEQHQFTIRDKDGNKIQTEWIHGTRMSGQRMIPKTLGDTHNEAVLILGKRPGEDRVTSTSGLHNNSKVNNELIASIEKGEHDATELYAAEHYPFNDSEIAPKAKGARIRYVISPTGVRASKELDIGGMVPRREGFHNDWDFNGATVQPDIKFDRNTNTYWYEGDKIITVHKSPAEGKDFGSRLDVNRQYLGDGMYDEAKEYLPGIPDETYAEWFKDTKTPDGKRMPPFLSTEHPIKYVKKGESYWDTHDLQKEYKDKGLNIRDGTTSGSASRQFQVQYTGKRDADQLFTVRNKGTWRQPLWQRDPADLLDATSVTGRALNRIINSQTGDDLKRASVTMWLREAVKHLDTSKMSENELWHNAWSVFNSKDFPWKRVSENEDKIRHLEANRRKIQQFSGAMNRNQSFMYSTAIKLNTMLYGVSPKMSILPIHMLPYASDPARITRSAVVHPLLGWFKPRAFFMQAATSGNVLGMAPAHAMQGYVGAMLHQASRLNSSAKYWSHLDSIASQLGYRPGEWLEARKGVVNTGFFHVGGSSGYIDDPTRARTIRGQGGQFLDAGMTPFEEGAQHVRAHAYYTSHHAFRHGHDNMYEWKGTTEAISREQRQQILNYAGTLDHNMSRVGNNEVQKNWGSIPLLFKAYQMRLTNLMLGHTLKPWQKVSLGLTSAILWGVPSGPLGLFGVPVGDYMRSSMVTGNWGVNVPFVGEIGHTNVEPYVIGDNFWTSMIMEGGIATGLAYATGAAQSGHSIADSAKHRLQTGNWYSVNEWGNQSLLGDLLKDSDLATVFMGAPGEWYAKLYAKSHPLAADIQAWAHGHDRGTTGNDIIHAATVINSISDAYLGITAAATHEWRTSNNTVMQKNVSLTNAGAMFLTGLRPQDALNKYQLGEAMRTQQRAWDQAEKLAVQELHWYKDAKDANDPTAAESHWVLANAYLKAVNYPENDGKYNFTKVFINAARTYKEDVPSMLVDRYLKNHPEFQSAAEKYDARARARGEN